MSQAVGSTPSCATAALMLIRSARPSPALGDRGKPAARCSPNSPSRGPLPRSTSGAEIAKDVPPVSSRKRKSLRLIKRFKDDASRFRRLHQRRQPHTESIAEPKQRPHTGIDRALLDADHHAAAHRRGPGKLIQRPAPRLALLPDPRTDRCSELGSLSIHSVHKFPVIASHSGGSAYVCGISVPGGGIARRTTAECDRRARAWQGQTGRSSTRPVATSPWQHADQTAVRMSGVEAGYVAGRPDVLSIAGSGLGAASADGGPREHRESFLDGRPPAGCGRRHRLAALERHGRTLAVADPSLRNLAWVWKVHARLL